MNVAGIAASGTVVTLEIPAILCSVPMEPRLRMARQRQSLSMDFDEHWMAYLYYTRMIQGLRPANERRRYFVTTSLIGWVQT